MSRIEKLNLYFWIISIFSILLLVRESNFIDNYEERKSFLLLFGSVGLGLFFLIIYVLKRKGFIFIKSRLKLGNSLIAGVLASCLTFFPLAGSKINRWFSSKDLNCKNYQLIKKEKVKKHRITKYLISIKQENKIKTIVVKKEKWEKLLENKPVDVCEHAGFLGFKFNTLNE